MAKKIAAHFSRKTISFFRDLKKNNKKTWFDANKSRYEEEVKAPFLRFIEDFAGPLAKISGHFVADARGNGGSMFRIYRDTRFSKDKTPYKSWGAIQFRHERGKDVHCPGFYLHIEPGKCIAGAGVWHPDTKTANRIRNFIVANPNTWTKIRKAAAFRRAWEFTGDSLKRPLRGFDPEHEHIEDLKRKDFIVLADFKDADLLRPDFINTYAKACKSAAPLVEYLCEAVGMDF